MRSLFSARNDEFLNLMVGTGGVAATGRIGLDGDSSSSPTEQVTHSCAGCRDGTPCSGCGGNVRLDSAAYKTFDWAVTMTASMPNPFWRAATVAETLRSASARDASSEWDALERLVRNEMDLMVAREQGQNAQLPILRLEKERIAVAPVTTDSGRRTLKLPDGTEITYVKVPGTTPTPATGQTQVCCPFLLYPIPVPTQFPPRASGNPAVWEVGNDFEALAIYSDDAPCSCSCCTFRQYVETSITGTGKGPPRRNATGDLDSSPLPFHEHREDSAITDGSRFGRGESESCATAKPHRACETNSRSSDANPTAGLSPKAIAALGAIVKAEGVKSYCIRYLKDNPSLVLLPGESKERVDCFLGVIKTLCPPCSVVASSSFSLYAQGSNSLQGVLSQSGAPHGLKRSDGTPAFSPSAACNAPPGSENDCK